MRILVSFCIFLSLCVVSHAEKIKLKASDGVEITADFLKPDGDYSTILVLYHMAGASRGEYREIAPQLNKLGYATLAVDQRSGGAFNGVKNETAAKSGGAVGYTKAIPDIVAAAEWARQNSGSRQVGVIGSSYSAGLVLVLAGQSRDFADAIISFSPGEYYGSSNYVAKELDGIRVPVFLTAARNEAGQWKPFESRIQSPVTGFVPEASGRHGATALVSGDGDEYWVALKAFLSEHLPAK
ncbi:MAG: alpha/beta fold hydrolase [Pseudomonadota bacterium]